MDTQLSQFASPSPDDGNFRKKPVIRLLGVGGAYGVPPDASPGSALAGQALRLADAGRGIRRNGLECIWDELLVLPPRASSEPREVSLRRLCLRLEARIVNLLNEQPDGTRLLPVILSGDHAVAEGAWRGMAQGCADMPGLLWIDAHLDAHTSLSTPSGNPHGMPLAALLGCMPNPWGQSVPVIDAHRTCVFGARSFEGAEFQRLQSLGVRVFGMEEISQRGLAEAFADALERVRRGGKPYGISLDLDALDPQSVHAVNTPVAFGLKVNELEDALRGVANDPAFIGFEVTEYNPLTDTDNRTALVVEHLLASLTSPDDEELMSLEATYGAHNYAPLPVVLVRAAACHAWDGSGKRYLDMMSAYSATSFGHAHPRIIAALTSQAQRLAVTSRAYYSDRLPLFLEKLCKMFAYEAALPVNTGLEAVETALKAARKWGHEIKGIPMDQAQIIACHGNFHGRSITITGLSSESQYRQGFGPFPAGLLRIPYGDIAALEAAITPQTAAFLVEPIQGEAGIRLPPAGYLRACAQICHRNNVLLICDEVQTGMARTGKLLATWHEDVRPDGVILGKALGGGVLPVSAFLADWRVMKVFRPGDHGSTFGGNALASAVALEALELVEELDLPHRATQLGEYLLQGLKAINSPAILEVRGKGLLVGIELSPGFDAREACLRLLQHGLLSKDTHGTVIRMAPPLIIGQSQLDEALGIIKKVLREMGG